MMVEAGLETLEGKKIRYEMARRKMAEFEAKYGMDLDAFCERFPEGGDMQTHEDWVEWNYWSEIHRRLKVLIDTLRKLSINN